MWFYISHLSYPAYAHDEDNHADDVQSDAQQGHEPDHTQLIGVDKLGFSVYHMATELMQLPIRPLKLRQQAFSNQGYIQDGKLFSRAMKQIVKSLEGGGTAGKWHYLPPPPPPKDQNNV